MIRRSCTLAALPIAALALAACTGSGSGRTHSSSGGPSTASTSTRSATVAPAPSPVATCTASSSRLTYHRHRVVTSEYGLALAGGGGTRSTITSPVHLDTVTVVRARADSPVPGAGLTRSVSRHWHTIAAALGQTTKTLDPHSTVTLRNNGGPNEAFVVYRVTHVYTGTYSTVCGGRTVTGHYTTFGPIAEVTENCRGGHPDALGRYARRGLC